MMIEHITFNDIGTLISALENYWQCPHSVKSQIMEYMHLHGL